MSGRVHQRGSSGQHVNRNGEALAVYASQQRCDKVTPLRGYNSGGSMERRSRGAAREGSKMGDNSTAPEPTPWFTLGGERVQVWLSERGLTALLIMLVLDLFVLPIFAPDLGHVALDVAYMVLLVTGAAALCATRVSRFLALGFAVLALAFRGLERADVSSITVLGSTAASLVTMIVFSLLVLLRTMSPGPITRFRIQGAVATFMLVGLTFAQAFELTEIVEPGSFQFAAAILPEDVPYELRYYSLVTLTTVGYGDVTPVSRTARSLANFEGLIGQLYPVVILGWMVASLRGRRPD